MPTIVTHAAIPLALGFGFGRKIIPGKLLIVGVAASMLPDIDVYGSRLGIAFNDIMGHRGVTHSLFLAALTAFYVGFSARFLGAKGWIAFLFTFVAMASHGLLDMLTTGGPGVALYWPWSDERMFFPVQVIRVSPIRLSSFFSERGVNVMISELAWVWFPCMAAMLVMSLNRIYGRRRRAGRNYAVTGVQTGGNE